MESMSKVSKENYKGVRDFYPEDQFIQNYIFSVWKKTMHSFGFEQYDASILESSELYEAKSGEEIVSTQTYNFIDRGDRSVTLRPEMTPTVARMIAKRKNELTFPLRWFSIPNLFRYERPQRGRLREHWQLNADLFGIESIDADAEMIEIAYTLLQNFGLNDIQFEIRVNNRRLINKIFGDMKLNDIQVHQMSKLLDKKSKIDDFDEQAEKILGKPFSIKIRADETIEALISKLKSRGISNVVFSPELMRGFDYYTDVVFEVFDTNPANNRSLFGGGRYNDLLDIFGEEKIPAVGFGMGDVTIRDVLETYELLPTFKPEVDLYLCIFNDSFSNITSELASELRAKGLNVSVDYTGKKIGDQVKKAHKKKIPFVICVGNDEIESGKFKVKTMESGDEKEVKRDQIAEYIKNNR